MLIIEANEDARITGPYINGGRGDVAGPSATRSASVMEEGNTRVRYSTVCPLLAVSLMMSHTRCRKLT